MNYFKIVYILLFFTLMSCKSDIPEEDRIAFRLARDAVNSFPAEYNLTLAGIIFSGDENYFRVIGIDMSSKFVLNKDEGRELVIKCANGLLKMINESEKLKPYLIQRPFTYENTVVKIFFFNDEMSNPIFFPNLCCVSLKDDIVLYRTADKENIFQYRSVEKESIDEALQILKEKGVSTDFP